MYRARDINKIVLTMTTVVDLGAFQFLRKLELNTENLV